MGENSKTLRQVLLGKLHRATVTRADLDYMGSITIDQDLIDAAGFLLNEKVDIYNITNGARLATYVIPGPRGSGELGINGAAAHLVKQGDLVIVAAYGWMKEKAARKHVPRVVLLDEGNHPVEVTDKEENPPRTLTAVAAKELDDDDEPDDEEEGELDDDAGDEEADDADEAEDEADEGPPPPDEDAADDKKKAKKAKKKAAKKNGKKK